MNWPFFGLVCLSLVWFAGVTPEQNVITSTGADILSHFYLSVLY